MKAYEVIDIIHNAAKEALREYVFTGDDLGTFLYGLPEEQNLQYSKPLPHIYLDPIRRTWNSANGEVTFPVTMFFLDKDTPDSTGEQMKLIEAKMESLQDEFIEALISQEVFNETTFTSTPLHRVNMGMFTGWQLNFTLVDKLVIC